MGVLCATDEPVKSRTWRAESGIYCPEPWECSALSVGHLFICNNFAPGGLGMGDSEPGNSRPKLAASTAATPALTPERWRKIKELFGLALEREATERSAFLND